MTMTLNIADDLLPCNFDDNRKPVDMIVIHTMVGTVAGASARFHDCAQKASAHYGIPLDGSQPIVRWVPNDEVAYHAGDYATNQRSVGIEHEDNGQYNAPRPDILYQRSAELVATLCQKYAMACNRATVKAHREVSDSPTSCPDALDVDRIVNQASVILGNTPGGGQSVDTVYEQRVDGLLGAMNTQVLPALLKLQQQMDGVLGAIGLQQDPAIRQLQQDVKALASQEVNDTGGK